ncbi:MAG: hypothetical protein H7301_00850 [Cryobacterium sp.]|nr:hypothetical protein [Oligoflexia bacterium]
MDFPSNQKLPILSKRRLLFFIVVVGFCFGIPPVPKFTRDQVREIRSPASSKGCSDIRLDDLGGAMEKVAVRNQRSIGNCYAHTAAQMYDAWRFKHDEKADRQHQSSGFEIGQRFKLHDPIRFRDSSIDGGFVQKVIPVIFENEAKKRGTCSEAELNSVFRSGNGPMTVDEFASGIMGLFNKYRSEFYRSRGRISDDDIRHPVAVQDRTQVASPARDRRNADFAPRNFGDSEAELRRDILGRGIVELKTYLLNHYTVNAPIRFDSLKADGDTVDMFETLGLAFCDPSHRLFSQGEFKARNLSTRKALNEIDSELNQGLNEAYPVGISYCANILGEGRNAFQRLKNDDECLNHASLVIGRRTNQKTNRCEYAIRNTWGAARNFSIDSHSGRPRADGNYHPDWTAEPEKGVVWVEGETLEKSVYEVQIMEPLRER